jgi:hypothetical protein
VNKVASGKVTDAANSVETALVQSIPVFLGFFPRLLSIENLAIKVKEWLSKLKARIDNFIDTLLNQEVNWLSKFPKGTKTGRLKPPSNNNTTASPSNQPDHDNKVRVGLGQIDKKETKYLKNGRIWKKDTQKVANKVKKYNPIFKSITVVDSGETWDYDWVASNGTKKGEKQAEKAQNDSGIIKSDTPLSLPYYKHIFHHGTIYLTAGKLKKEDIEAIGANNFGKGLYVHTKESWHKAKESVEGKDEGWGVVIFPIPNDIWKQEVQLVD